MGAHLGSFAADFLTSQEAARLAGIGRRVYKARVSRGFPSPVKYERIGPRGNLVALYSRIEVEQWMLARCQKVIEYDRMFPRRVSPSVRALYEIQEVDD